MSQVQTLFLSFFLFSLSLSLSSRAAVGQHNRPQVDASLLSFETVQSVLVVGVLLLSVYS